MLSETLEKGLREYRIGEKIRALRGKKKLGLVQLGQHTGLSPAMLSKIERGQIFPTLPTLLRIALVFGVGLDHFFGADEDKPLAVVVRKEDRLRLPDRTEGAPSYYFESLDFPVADRKMEAYFAEFPASAAPSAAHSHPGAELIYVFKGELTIDINGETTTLRKGDSIYFDPSAPHRYQCSGRAACSAIVVIAP